MGTEFKPHGGFKKTKLDIREEIESHDSRVVKVSAPVENKIEEFEFNSIRSGRRTVGGSASKSSQKNAHFHLSHLTRDALQIPEEEAERIEQRIRSELSGEAEKIRAEALGRGEQEGREQGREAAYTEHRAACEDKLQALQSIVAEMEGVKNAVFEANRDFLMDLVFRISKMVILREVATDREYLLRLTKELLERNGLRENISIRVSPADAASIEELRAGLMQSFGALRNLSIEASDQVKAGGIVLESDLGMIDASLDTQIASVAEALKGGAGPTV